MLAFSRKVRNWSGVKGKLVSFIFYRSGLKKIFCSRYSVMRLKF